MNFLAPPKRIGERTASRNALGINHPLSESSAAARIPISMLPFVGGAASGYTQEDLATLDLPEETTLFSPLGFDITDWHLARLGLATDALDWVPGAAVLGGLATGAGMIGRAAKGANYADTTGDALESMVAAGAARHSPTNGLADMTVYHGSPHQFDQFDMSKIGTGEGAQAYGHGLYFAENPGVARGYKTFGDADDLVVRRNGKEIARGDQIDDDLLDVYGLLERGKNTAGEFKHNTAHFAKLAAESRFTPGERLEKLKGLIDEYADATFTYEKNPGNLYDVDIPDTEIAKMLDWDAPLSEIPESLKEKLLDLEETIGGSFWEQDYQALESLKGKTTKSFKGSDLLAELEYMMGGAYSGNPNGSIAASDWLKDQGIPGIKYYDGGSRTADEGTRNFVGFDDKLPTILT